MTVYDQIIEAHAPRARQLYAAKWDELCALAGLTIKDDGSNNASSEADLNKYLKAIETICGAVGHTSALLAMRRKAEELSVEVSF